MVGRQFAMVTSRLRGKNGCNWREREYAQLCVGTGDVMNSVAFHEKGFCMEYMCLLREGLYVRSSCAF